MAKVLTVSFQTLGMHSALDPIAVAVDGYQLGINVSLAKQAISQRAGMREIPLRSDTAGLVETFQRLNFQGATRYQPSKGQSALQFSSKGDFIAISAAGRKFLIEVIGRGAAVYGNLIEITGGFPQAPDLHMSFMAQAENYLIAADDFGSTWIYDGVNASLSVGYNPSNPANSRVPNRSRLPVYTHGRLAIVSGGRSTLVGDIIHGDGKTDSSALLDFIEQVYWATGAEFALPTDAGAILALYNLPTLGRSSDHGELVIEAEERVYTLKTQLYPRTTWIDTPNMLVTVSAEGGARGPWAFDVYQDNAVRRTLNGIETLTFSRRGSDIVYEPQEILSSPIEDTLKNDFGPLLRFNSTQVHRANKRLYSTVRPWISGYHWKHRGAVSYNYYRKLWEGVNVNPSPIKDVKAFVSLPMSGEQRMFQIAGDDESGSTIRLLEIEPALREDILVEGTYPIASAIHTRAIYDDLQEAMAIHEGSLHFARVSGTIDWEVYWRSDWSQGCWTLWNKGQVCHKSTSAPATKDVELGVFNGREIEGVRRNSGKSFEFLIKWKGKADLRFHVVDATNQTIELANVVDPPQCTEDPICCDANQDLFIPF